MKTFLCISLLTLFLGTALNLTPVQAGGNDETDKAEAFQQFWKNFRDAAQYDDFNVMEAMTRFPLVAHGTLDDDPMVKVPKTKFEKLMKLFLKQTTGTNSQNIDETNNDYIRANETITFNNDGRIPAIDGNTARVTDMVFTYKKGEWKFTSLYISDDTRQGLKR